VGLPQDPRRTPDPGIPGCAATVRSILKVAGIDPAPRRSEPTGGAFLKAQAQGIVACDLFHEDTIFLRRPYIFSTVDHATHRVRIDGTTTHPTRDQLAQQTRNLTMDPDDAKHRIRFLIRDRDTRFTEAFTAVFTAMGADVIMIPPRAPRANAIAERFVGSVHRELLDRILALNATHTVRILGEYEEHFTTHRPHRSPGQAAAPTSSSRARVGP
jgi:putative transposase